MTFDEEQDVLAAITNETAKLKRLKETHDLELKQMKNTKKAPNASEIADKLCQERKEKLDHDLLSKRESEEKRHLLQAVISEAEESGFPMPPSLIKLLNHTNGKFFKSFFFFF